MDGYEFTNDWFERTARPLWEALILPQLAPRRVLEVGSYEGASACYLIEALGARQALELHCVDTWEGSIEHQPGGHAAVDMAAVHARFQANTRRAIGRAGHAIELSVHRGRSDTCLPMLLAQGKAGYFDFVYIDGSHQAPDVLFDALLGFRLLRPGGVMAFDDYLWSEPLPGGPDPLRCPKPAIDAFVNIHLRQLVVLSAPLAQLYVLKRPA